MATASIFICHAPSDTAFARDLELALETFRLSVWRDNRGLRGGNRLAPMVRATGSRQWYVGPSSKPDKSSWCSA